MKFTEITDLAKSYGSHFRTNAGDWVCTFDHQSLINFVHKLLEKAAKEIPAEVEAVANSGAGPVNLTVYGLRTENERLRNKLAEVRKAYEPYHDHNIKALQAENEKFKVCQEADAETIKRLTDERNKTCDAFHVAQEELVRLRQSLELEYKKAFELASVLRTALWQYDGQQVPSVPVKVQASGGSTSQQIQQIVQDAQYGANMWGGPAKPYQS